MSTANTVAAIKEAERIVFQEIWNQGRLDLIPKIFSPRWHAHDPGPPTIEGRVRNLREALPDIRYDVHDVIVEGDRAAIRWTARGTHRGPLFGIPPTGKSLEISGVIVDRFEDGVIVEHWGFWDRQSLMQQLSLV
jgi:steroid delta-isomerase-like uncharacterized protein